MRDLRRLFRGKDERKRLRCAGFHFRPGAGRIGIGADLRAPILRLRVQFQLDRMVGIVFQRQRNARLPAAEGDVEIDVLPSLMFCHPLTPV